MNAANYATIGRTDLNSTILEEMKDAPRLIARGPTAGRHLSGSLPRGAALLAEKSFDWENVQNPAAVE